MSIRRAVGFLTPLGGASPPSPSTLPWFPVVGAALGVTLGVVWRGAAHVWPRPVAAALVVAVDLALTGLLHLDGLVDSADGLLPHLDRARRLEVMAAPDAGAFGVGVAGAVVLLRWVALASLSPSVLLLAALWCGSRTVMAGTALVVPYARASEGGGLATAFLPAPGGRAPMAAAVAAVGFGGAAVLAVLWRPLAGVVSLAAALGAAGAVVALARRRIGGFTGDVLGAAGVIAETVGLVVASARW